MTLHLKFVKYIVINEKKKSNSRSHSENKFMWDGFKNYPV